MAEDPRLVLDPQEIGALQNEIQAANYIRERIGKVKDELAAMPPLPEDPLTGSVYLSWHRKTMILYGQAIGALQAVQAFGHITIPMFVQLKRELISVLSGTMLQVQLGEKQI